eukprot:Nk52_evm72s745 gene=Nk52_evmTU72s745
MSIASSLIDGTRINSNAESSSLCPRTAATSTVAVFDGPFLSKEHPQNALSYKSLSSCSLNSTSLSCNSSVTSLVPLSGTTTPNSESQSSLSSLRTKTSPALSGSDNLNPQSRSISPTSTHIRTLCTDRDNIRYRDLEQQQQHMSLHSTQINSPEHTTIKKFIQSDTREANLSMNSIHLAIPSGSVARHDAKSVPEIPLDAEILFLDLLAKFPPKGLHKNALMFCILDSVRNNPDLNEYIDSKYAWGYLGDLYHLEELDKKRGGEVPEVTDFSLPEDIMGFRSETEMDRVKKTLDEAKGACLVCNNDKENEEINILDDMDPEPESKENEMSKSVLGNYNVRDVDNSMESIVTGTEKSDCTPLGEIEKKRGRGRGSSIKKLKAEQVKKRKYTKKSQSTTPASTAVPPAKRGPGRRPANGCSGTSFTANPLMAASSNSMTTATPLGGSTLFNVAATEDPAPSPCTPDFVKGISRRSSRPTRSALRQSATSKKQ